MAEPTPPVAIIMGSQSDWATMRHAAETLDALGVQRAHLVGNSMGGRVAIEAGLMQNDRVGGLLRYGIPDFKLEKEVIERRLRVMEAEGTRFRPGVEIGRRHFPLNSPFQNGPIHGKDVFIPLSQLIGGAEMAGKGWNMLNECLAVGRSITLPSTASGGAKFGAVVTGAYARIRKQFGLSVGRFEGVEEALRGAPHELGVGADLHERDARHVHRDAVGCLGRRLHLDLPRAQRDHLGALGQRVHERTAAGDHGDPG